jgi:hypothetical protein
LTQPAHVAKVREATPTQGSLSGAEYGPSIAVHLWRIAYGFHLGAFYQSPPEASPAGS